MTPPQTNGEKPLNHRQRKSIAAAQRIYAEFKWNINKTKGQLSLPDLVELLNAAINLCHECIPDDTIRRECLQKFTTSKANAEKLIAQGQATELPPLP